MKLRLPRRSGEPRRDPDRGLPGYLFGGRIRTTTVALILAFVVMWWAYDANRPTPNPPEVPQVVPPGFVPDPNYTWVPRSRLEQPPVTITETLTPETVTETLTPPPETSEPVPPPFGLPPLPGLPLPGLPPPPGVPASPPDVPSPGVPASPSPGVPASPPPR